MFTESEIRFLTETARGRLSTLGSNETPQIHPVRFVVETESGSVDVIGARLRDSQKYRNVRRDPRVTLTVDDPCLPLSGLDDRSVGRGLRIHGLAAVAESYGLDVIRVRPVRLDEWNLERAARRSRFLD